MDHVERWDNINVLTNSDTDLEVKSTLDNGGDRKKIEIKNYIPKRSNEKFLKHVYIIGGITLLVFIFIIMATIILKKSGTDEQSALKKFPLGIILRTDDRFWIYDRKTQELNFLIEINIPISTFDVIGRQKIIMVEANKSRIVSVSSDNSNPPRHNFEFIFDDARMKPKGLAIDFLTDNIYIVDEELGILVVMNTKSKMYNILLTELEKPREIILDPSQGLMFICQFSDSILRGNMDGTALTKIVPDAEIGAITLDRKAKRIYWVQDFMSIESSDYDGKDRKQFFADSVEIAGLAILDDQFFWLWPKYGHLNTTLWSCRLNNDTCEEHAMHEFDSAKNVKHIRASVDPSEEIANLCKVSNGGCQHLCLMMPDGGRSCACKLGWQLNLDRKTCRQVSDFVLYTKDNFIRGRIVDKTKTALVDVFWPTQYNINSVRTKGTIDFDYDGNNDSFYFSDDSNIYQIKLKKQSQQTILLSNDRNEIMEDIAIDWLTGNLYYSLRSTVHSKRHYLMMFNVNQGSEYKKVITNFVYDGVFGLQACPYAIALYPSKGLLFFTAGEDNQRSIQRLTLNGTKLSQIYNIPYVHEHRLITIDYEKDKLYWIFNTEELVTKIKYTDFDGSNEKIITIESMSMARTISVYHQWLFISNDTAIFRVHKETGNGLVRIIPEFNDDQRVNKIAGARIISAAIQSSKIEDNPCAVNNGGCHRFCFAGPSKTCG